MRKPESGVPKYLFERFAKENLESERMYEQFSLDFEIAEQIYSLREKAGLTQGGLAKLVGTTQSVISRLKMPIMKVTLYPCSSELHQPWGTA